MAIDQVKIVSLAVKSKYIADIRKQGLANYTIKPVQSGINRECIA
jgi:hypothetical protein